MEYSNSGLSRKELIEIAISSGWDDAFKKLRTRFWSVPVGGLRETVEHDFRNLIKNYDGKRKMCNNTHDRVVMRYGKWLEQPYMAPTALIFGSNPSGRPQVPFEEKTAWSKHAATSSLSSELDRFQTRELLLAASKTLKRRGESDLSRILVESSISPSRPKKISRLIRNPKDSTSTCSPIEALALIFDLNLSKSQYMALRSSAIRHGAKLYPSYHTISEAKKSCRPPKEDITITETCASLPLQSLVDHTTNRLVLYLDEVINQHMESEHISELETVLIYTWGFDGSSGQSNYKQKFEHTTDGDDSCLFAISIIPLRLLTRNGVVLWNNPTPQSIRYCRPLKLIYCKETEDLINREKAAVEAEIHNLISVGIELSNEKKIISVQIQMYMTVIDGKVLNTITGNKSTQSCPICKATPTDFNNLSNIGKGKFVPDENALMYGISPLHAWIRCLECVLHISYRLEFKRWRVNKEKIVQRKREIQQRLLREMGLRVDFVKVGGGTSNDGNTARRAFQNHETFADILGLHPEFIKDVHTLLCALSCQLPIDPDKFNAFCVGLAQNYVTLYGWYYMPPTLHKILIHGHEIIRSSVLPLGMMGEDAGESSHRIRKAGREHHSRKMSRIKTAADVMNRALEMSDPYLTGLTLSTRKNKRKVLPLPHEVLELLEDPTVNSQRQLFPDNDSESENDEEEDVLEISMLDTIVLEEETDDIC